MKLNQVALGNLLSNILIKHSAIIAEVRMLFGDTLSVTADCLCDC